MLRPCLSASSSLIQPQGIGKSEGVAQIGEKQRRLASIDMYRKQSDVSQREVVGRVEGVMLWNFLRGARV